MKHFLFAWMVLLLVACEPLDVANTPEFNGLTRAAALSESQIEIHWNPPMVDAPEEIAYGIWFGESGQSLDLTASPDIITKEGALSYNLVELDAAKTYQIVVRARGRGTPFSSNQTAAEITLPEEGRGLYQKGLVIDLSGTPQQLLAGRIFGSGRDDLAVVRSQDIQFYESRPSGFVLNANGVALSESVTAARLLPFKTNATLLDLVVLTTQSLIYFENRDGQFQAGQTPFRGTLPLRNLTHVARDNQGAVLTYADALGLVYFYSLEDEELILENSENLANRDAAFQIADFDNDDLFDLAAFGANGLRVALGTDEGFLFGTDEIVDETGPEQGDSFQLFAHDGNGDGNADLFVFLRNTANDKTELKIYEGEGDGNFKEALVRDYRSAFYETASFQNADGEGVLDFVAPQSSANNVVLLRGSAGAFAYQTVSHAYGGPGEPNAAVFGDYDGLFNRDLAILLVSEKKLVVLNSNSATFQ